MQSISDKTTLYEQDFCLWVDDTVAKLKSGNFAQLDLDNLIEEVESLAGRDRRELESRLGTLLTHLLKRCYVSMPENHRGWELTIREQRKELGILLRQSPSLRPYLTNIFEQTWESALADVRQDYPTAKFPDRWQFSQTVEMLLSEPFWALGAASETSNA